MKILFLSRWYPYPPDNGSKLRVYHLLRTLAQEHRVTLLTFKDEGITQLQSHEINALCEQVEAVPWKRYNPSSPRALAGLFNLAPRSIVDTYSLEMEQRLREQLTTRDYDLIIASQFSMAAYSRWFDGRPAIFEEVESGLFYEQYKHSVSALQQIRFGLTWAKYRQYLRALMKNFQAYTVVSEQEKQLLSGLIGNNQRIEVIPNGIHLDDYQNISETPRPGHLIFTGSFRYHPNYEAMVWFLEEVFPRIQAEAPGVGLTITGDHMNMKLPYYRGIVLTGFVDDIRPLVASSWASLAPLRTGGGTRLKILESMALRTPVITTSKGAEGLEVRHGEHILVADSVDEFAKMVIKLLNNPELRQRLADNAHRIIREKYEWSIIAPQFFRLLENIVGLPSFDSGGTVH